MGILFVVGRAPHGPVAASLVAAAVAVVLGLADIRTPTSQRRSAGFAGNLGTPQNHPAFLSPSLSGAGPVRLAPDRFMLWHSLEDRL